MGATLVDRPAVPTVTPPPTRRRGGTGRLVVRYLVTLLGVVTLVFAIPRAMPGDPLGALLQDEAGTEQLDQSREVLAEHYGLDRPLAEQYVRYLTDVARADLGRSIANGQPVSRTIRDRLPWTLLLVGTALALSAAVSFVAGVGAAWRRGRLGDRVTTSVVTVLGAAPEYAVATILLILFAGTFQWFPVAGASTPYNDFGLVSKVVDVVKHLVLPATALALSLIGVKFLLVRNAVIGILGQDYMVAARAKGLTEDRRKYRHAGRNALVPFLNIVAVQVGVAIGGALFVEQVFSYPGLASVMMPAVTRLDYPLIEGCFLVVAFVAVTANLVVDLVSARIDPRVGR
ncbi:MAG TPA: ABC transporter permease [Acidimicrobiales bacterium]|nr:ABC transporter permease [Acidimicrobiales bacterium]